MPYRTLVDVPTLAAHIDDLDWVTVDCRFSLADTAAGHRAYAAGHIPGARYADLDRDLSGPVTPVTGRHPLPDPAALARRLGGWGIGAGVQVVAYDDTGGTLAARLWWLLRWLGHEQAAVLDGGLGAWKAAGHALTAAAPDPVARTFTGRPRAALEVGTLGVEQALDAGDYVLVDARAAPRFRGEEEPLDPVAGHIPGAVNLPCEGNLDAGGHFRSPAELRQRFAAALGARSCTAVIHYCGSGVTACHNLLAMEHVGLGGSRLYPGSWSEWIRDPNRPVQP